ncbi:hypothetical protein K474DRAFT_1680153 [Panus rudis PR-1116 ss-1]|nr:hypothetical protein K474DRAFT_1680153 [Panus rudis PR-1116 ss-1]
MSRKQYPRSPAHPKSPIPSGSRVPTFQPPSYYAAAAGLSYTPPSSSLSPANASRSPALSSRSADPHAATSIPISYPTQMSQDDAVRAGPVEYIHHDPQQTPARRKRSTSISRSLSRAMPKSNRHEKEQEDLRRKSQFVDLPLLETQLIPSLRDTIDRMTQPPRQRSDEAVEAASRSDYTRTTVNPGDIVHYNEGSPANALSPTNTLSPRWNSSRYGSALSPHHNEPVSHGYAHTNPNEPIVSPSDRRPSRFVSSTPKSPQVNAKSALRSPRVSQEDEQLAQPQSEVLPKSLRSVKGITPGNTPRTIQSPSVKSPSSSRSPYLRQTQDDPGSSRIPSASASSSKQSRSNGGTPKATPKSSVLSPTNTRQRSGIPRSTPYTTLPNATDSGSELERTYERKFTGGRLVVTNGSVVPSDSETGASDIEREDYGRTNVNQYAKSPRSAKLDTYQRTPKLPGIRSGSAAQSPHRLGAQRLDQRQSGFGLGLQLDTAEDAAHPHDGHFYGSSRGHSGDTSRKSVRNPQDAEQEVYRDSGQRTSFQRREALLGIVDSLQLGIDSQQGTNLTQSESDVDYSAQGLAISSSVEFVEQRTRPEASLRNRRGSAPQDQPVESTKVDTSRRNGEEDYAEYSGRHGRSKRRSKSPLPEEKPDEAIRKRRSSSVPAPPRSPRTKGSREDPMGYDHYRAERDDLHPDDKPSHTSRSRRRQSTSTNAQPSVAENTSTRYHERSPRSSSRNSHKSVTFAPQNESLLGNDIARQRQGFGIPASLSYGAQGQDEHQDPKQINSHVEPEDDNVSISSDYSQQLSHADSDLSSIDGGRWQPKAEVGGFSHGAEKLFRTLSSSTAESTHPSRRHGSRRMGSARHHDHSNREDTRTQVARDEYLPPPGSQRCRPLSTSSSAPSVYEEEPAKEEYWDDNQEEHDPYSSSLQGTLHRSTYNSLLARVGPLEVERQEVIQSLTTSENQFVERLRNIVQLFVLPLRRRDRQTWLPGVPEHVARLFDWLDDIVNLHAGIANSLNSTQHCLNPGDVVERLAESLRSFVPRLEIYQPYIIRVESVKQLIAQLVADSKSEFGEFVRIREQDPACQGLKLVDLLQEPIDRLTGYQSIFQRLLEVTPRHHCDHLPTLSLLHSMRMMMHVLLEVKAREDEYEHVKEIWSRVDGIPAGMQLARRERRLLWDGVMNLSPTTGHFKSDQRRPTEANDHGRSLRRGTSHERSRRDASQRASKLVDAEEGWGHQRQRSRSINSSASSLSSGSYSASSSGASMPNTPMWDRHHERYNTPKIVLSHSTSDEHGLSEGKGQYTPGISSQITPSTSSTTVTAMVFTDIVVLASQVGRTRDRRDEKLKLLAPGGVSRLLGLHESTDKDGNQTLSLDILPISENELQTGIISESTSVTSVTLTLPSLLTDDQRRNALSALHRCHAYTIRSLSFPSHSGKYLAHGMQVDLEQDTQQSLMAILSTGLPLPKSPSVQISEVEKGQAMNPTEQEREERGWWSLRFQQVLREMRRQDTSRSMDLIGTLS